MFFVTDTLWSLTWSWIVLSRERCVSACYAEICFLPESMTEARLSYTSWFLSADILSLSFMPRTSNKYPLGNPEDRNCKNGGSEDSSTEQFLNCCRDCEHFVQCCFHCVPHLQSSSVRGARFTASGRPEISRWGNWRKWTGRFNASKQESCWVSWNVKKLQQLPRCLRSLIWTRSFCKGTTMLFLAKRKVASMVNAGVFRVSCSKKGKIPLKFGVFSRT